MPKAVRLFIVGLVAAAVAVLPLAGGIAHAGWPSTLEASSTVEHGDCCDHGKSCEKKKPDGCGSTAGCMVKCSFMSAAVSATSVPEPYHDGEKMHLVVARLASFHDNPPSPPPRA